MVTSAQKIKTEKPLGYSVRSKFNAGDLVAWKNLSSMTKLGLIKEIYCKEQGGRPVVFARVFLVKDGKKNLPLCEEEIIIIRLRLVSKA